MLAQPFQIYKQNCFYLSNLLTIIIPLRYLRRLLAVPPEGEDVLARLHLGHLHLVHDGEEELGGTWSYVALSVPREAGGWRRELRWMGEK